MQGSDTAISGALGQVAITVQDVARATAFYRDAVGLPLLFEVGGMSFFDCGGTRLMLSPVRGEAPSANGSTVLYLRADDITAAHASLSSRGVSFMQPPHLVAKMPDHELWLAFFGDGEGNVWGLMSEVR